MGRSSASLGNRLFFSLRLVGDPRPSLYVSDGTAAGTRRLPAAAPGEMAALGNQVLFTAFDSSTQGLWRTDGTAAGTRRVLGSGSEAPPENPAELSVFRGRVFFSVPSGGGRELWASDGTDAGTTPILNLTPANPAHLTVHQGWPYLLADDRVHGNELWRTDGTAAGTHLVADLAPGPDSFDLKALASIGARLYIFGTVPGSLTAGLWKSDNGGPVTRIPGFSRVPGPPLAVMGNRMFFTVGEEAELWQSDGTPAGTRRILAADGAPLTFTSSLLPLGNRLVFAAESHAFFGGQALWQWDGTAPGTRELHRLSGPGDSTPSWPLFRAGNRIFFPAYAPDTGRELWAVGP